MKELDFVLSDKQYRILQQQYSSTINKDIWIVSKHLNGIIYCLQTNNFGMSAEAKIQILNHLLLAKDVITLVLPNKYGPTIQLNNEPLKLLYELSYLSTKLNSINHKSPLQIIFSKTNSITPTPFVRANCVLGAVLWLSALSYSARITEKGTT